jgi:hypothetical protein
MLGVGFVIRRDPVKKLTSFVSVFVLAMSTRLFAAQVIPAGALLQCTTADNHISSKTMAVGDPILCAVSHFSIFGHSALPYGSYLSGTFDDYHDPGHLVGKGWMVLRFDRLVIPPNTVIPISTKVVDVPQYPVDAEGRIHGKGHAVRDVVTWSIPILWPIDLVNLYRRGPRPNLRTETRITVKLMEDVEVPSFEEAPIAPQQPTEPALKQRPVTYQVPDRQYVVPYQPVQVYYYSPAYGMPVMTSYYAYNH